jgi:hypothetical protein
MRTRLSHPALMFMLTLAACSVEPSTETSIQEIGTPPPPPPPDPIPDGMCSYQLRTEEPGLNFSTLTVHNCPEGYMCPSTGPADTSCSVTGSGIGQANFTCMCTATPNACDPAVLFPRLGDANYQEREAASAQVLACCTTPEYLSSIISAMQATPVLEIADRLERASVQCGKRVKCFGTGYVTQALWCKSPAFYTGAPPILRAHNCFRFGDVWWLTYTTECRYVWPQAFDARPSTWPETPEGTLAWACPQPAWAPITNHASPMQLPGLLAFCNADGTINNQQAADAYVAGNANPVCAQNIDREFEGSRLRCGP